MAIFDLYQSLKSKYQDRNRDYEILLEKYNAKFWTSDSEEEDDLFVGNSKEGLKLVINKLWVAVNSYVKYLSLPFDIEVTPINEKEKAKLQADKIEKLLYNIYEENELSMLQQWLTWYLSCLGTGVLVAKPHPDRLIDIEVINPKDFYGIPKDSRFLEFYHIFIEKSINGGYLHKYDERFSPYENYNIIEYWNEDEFKVFTNDGDEIYSKEHGFGFIPVVVIQNNVYPNRGYGQSDIEQAIGLNDYLNVLFSNEGDIIDYYSNPKLILKNTNLDPSQIETGPGGYITLEKDADAHYLQWTGNAPDVERQIQRVEKAIEEITGIIAPLFGRVKGSIVTGKAITNLLAGVEISIKAKQFLIGSRLAKFNEYMLKMIEKLYWDKEIILVGSRYESPYSIKMKGQDIKGYYKNRIIWSLSNFDYSSLVVVELQKLGAKLQSRYTTMQNLKIRSPYDEIKRIREEIKEDIQLQAEMRKFAQDNMSEVIAPKMPGEIAKKQKQLEKGMTPKEKNIDINDIDKIESKLKEALKEDQTRIEAEEIISRLANQDYNGKIWIIGGLAQDGFTTHDVDIAYQDPEDAKKVQELLNDLNFDVHLIQVNEPKGVAIEISKNLGDLNA